MKFNFPKPRVKKSTWLEIDQDIYEGLEKISRDKDIPLLIVVSTFVTAAWNEYQKEQEPKKDIQPLQEEIPDEKDKLNEFGHKVVGWSYAHEKCVSCGTTKRKHMAKGLCTRCYMRQPGRTGRNKKNDWITRKNGTRVNLSWDRPNDSENKHEILPDTCTKCGMRLDNEHEGYRSALIPSLCYSCDGSRQEQEGETGYYTSPSEGGFGSK